VGKRAEEAGEARLTGFVEFENQNKQSFQCEDIGDKFFHMNGLGICTVLSVYVCMYVCLCLRSVTQNAAVRSAFVICFKTNLNRKMK
jgi:hypothetical protein